MVVAGWGPVVVGWGPVVVGWGYLPLTMLYLLASSAACTPLPLPVGPSRAILGVCGAADRMLLCRNVNTEKKKRNIFIINATCTRNCCF